MNDYYNISKLNKFAGTLNAAKIGFVQDWVRSKDEKLQFQIPCKIKFFPYRQEIKASSTVKREYSQKLHKKKNVKIKTASKYNFFLNIKNLIS